ncbi:MAG: hypothetical protein IKK29_07830, partial [Christensenellaceae bacterium]|nr:hypothetical protein [Christensenellaceae bacterium]
MIKKVLNAIWGFFHRGFLTKLLALALAFIIWCYVTAGTNPIRGKDVQNVVLSLTNTAELTAKNLIIDDALSEIPESVDVKIEANVESHKHINANSIRATVNLAEVNSIGDVTLNISATSTQSGVVVKSISPSRVTLRVDELTEREIPVTAQLTGEEQPGYYVSTPKLSENKVILRGAKNRIKDIVKAVCEIPIDNLTQNERASYMLTLYDAENNIVGSDNIVGGAPSVIADLTVLPSKMVGIRPDDVIAAVTNIKPGYEINSVVTEPSTIEIAAEQSVLDEIDVLRVQPINAEEADKTIMVEAALQIPEGIEHISRSSVEVLLQIGEIRAEKVFKNQKIELKNLDQSLKAEILNVKYADVT